MACTIKAQSRVGCSTGRREGKGKGELLREREIEVERERQEGGGQEVLKKMWSKTEKKESSFIV